MPWYAWAISVYMILNFGVCLTCLANGQKVMDLTVAGILSGMTFRGLALWAIASVGAFNAVAVALLVYWVFCTIEEAVQYGRPVYVTPVGMLRLTVSTGVVIELLTSGTAV